MARCARGGSLWNKYTARALPVEHLNMAYSRLKANKDILGALVHLRKKNWGRWGGDGGNNRRRVTPSDIAVGHALR